MYKQFEYNNKLQYIDINETFVLIKKKKHMELPPLFLNLPFHINV